MYVFVHYINHIIGLAPLSIVPGPVYTIAYANRRRCAMLPHDIEHVKVYGCPDEYCAWPSVAALRDGSIVVAFCRSEEHLGPTGAVVSVRSTDGGRSWSSPTTILNSVIDDRESGFTALPDGRLMVHLWSTHHTPAMYLSLDPLSYEPAVLQRWITLVRQAEYSDARGLEGARCAITADCGITWSSPVAGPDSVHGGCVIGDGSVLIASYRINAPDVCLYRGSGSPISWNVQSKVPLPALRSTRFGEPHVAALPTGRIVLFLRSTAIPYDDMSERNLLWASYSDNEGRTWAEPYPTPLWGFPPHLLVLADGRVLCTYGYRRPPFGQRACVSEDGITWKAENEIILRDDAENGDLGYPASAELEPGKIITVYYQPVRGEVPPRMRPPDPERSKPDIMASIWTLPAELL